MKSGGEIGTTLSPRSSAWYNDNLSDPNMWKYDAYRQLFVPSSSYEKYFLKSRYVQPGATTWMRFGQHIMGTTGVYQSDGLLVYMTQGNERAEQTETGRIKPYVRFLTETYKIASDGTGLFIIPK